jgi:hypothetical protein
MEARTISRHDARVAKLKLHVIQQQGLAAEFVRQGDPERARQARSRLLDLLFQLDVVQQSPMDRAASTETRRE